MPYPFSLPTTSSLLLSSHLSSPTHPSLPLTATTYRTVLRDVLKRHKRLAPQSQLSHLGRVLSALNDYLPYLFALDAGLSNGGEDEGDDEHDGVDDYYLIDVVLECEVEVQWRATLTATLPGREPGRVKVRSLEYEICFVLATLAYTHTLLARNQLYLWKDPTATTTPLQQQRTTAIQTATKHLLQSASIHSYIAVQRSTQWAVPSPVLDISTSVQTALSSLALAEASLLAVLKDDPYAAAVAKDRDKNDNDWMVKAPEIPKVRAHLFARLCLSAAEHAGRASAMLRTAGGNNATTKAAAVDETLVGYVDDVRRTARGKACRFLGIDADLSGQIGVAIAWLLAAKTELGVHVEKGNGGGAGGIVGRRWKERREERKSEKGFDGGKVEESRIVNMLETKWTKINDTVCYYHHIYIYTINSLPNPTHDPSG